MFPFIFQLHEDSINDLCFLDGSWPWGSGKPVLVSGSSVGQVKVNSVDGRPLCAFTTEPPVTCLAPSPEPYNTTVSQGYPSEYCWVSIMLMLFVREGKYLPNQRSMNSFVCDSDVNIWHCLIWLIIWVIWWMGLNWDYNKPSSIL